MHRRLKYIPISLLLFVAFLSQSLARQSISVKVNTDVDISVDIFAAKNNPDGTIFIWQPHEKGLQNADIQLAQQLAEIGTEVWLLDLFSI